MSLVNSNSIINWFNKNDVSIKCDCTCKEFEKVINCKTNCKNISSYKIYESTELKTTLLRWNPRNKTVVNGSGFRFLDKTPAITDELKVDFVNYIDLFEQFYKLNNQLKYCNGSHYTFKDKTLESKYKEWLKSDDYKKKSFSLYYGNGVVD
jgi:hypothetical protein